jgi:DNA polymerase III epsilon subunit-like protein
MAALAFAHAPPPARPPTFAWTEEQQSCLRAFEETQKQQDGLTTQLWTVRACAGAGKTTLLLGLVDRAPPSWSILLLVFNARLKEDTRNRLTRAQARRTHVHTYHSFVRMIDSIAGMPTSDDMLRAARRRSPVQAFHMVMIDEAQDLDPLLYEIICRRLVVTRRLVVVGDARQAVYTYRGADSRFLTLAPLLWPAYEHHGACHDHRLSTSQRATIEVAAFVSRVMVHAPILYSHKSCATFPVQYWHGDSAEQASAIVHGLLKEGYAKDDILMLAVSVRSKGGPVKRMQHTLSEHLVFVDEHFSARHGTNKIQCNTLVAAKGTESRIVIVMGFDQSYFDLYDREGDRSVCPNALYVACTRARERLYVMHDASYPPLPFLDMEALQELSSHGLVRVHPSVASVRQSFVDSSLEPPASAFSWFQLQHKNPVQLAAIAQQCVRVDVGFAMDMIGESEGGSGESESREVAGAVAGGGDTRTPVWVRDVVCDDESVESVFPVVMMAVTYCYERHVVGRARNETSLHTSFRGTADATMTDDMFLLQVDAQRSGNLQKVRHVRSCFLPLEHQQWIGRRVRMWLDMYGDGGGGGGVVDPWRVDVVAEEAPFNARMDLLSPDGRTGILFCMETWSQQEPPVQWVLACAIAGALHKTSTTVLVHLLDGLSWVIHGQANLLTQLAGMDDVVRVENDAWVRQQLDHVASSRLSDMSVASTVVRPPPTSDPSTPSIQTFFAPSSSPAATSPPPAAATSPPPAAASSSPPAAATSHPPAAATSHPPASATSPPPAAASPPPAAAFFHPSASATSPPPAASSFSPPAASSFSPPVASSFSPPAASSFSPPVASSFSPPAAASSHPPAAAFFHPPAAAYDRSPAAAYDRSPAAAYDRSPAAASRASPPPSVMLVVDTETQAINRSQPWPPRMVSVAVLVLHVAPDRIELHRTWSTLIRPDGFQVTGSSIHGITHQRAMTHGMPLRRAMSMVQEMMAGAAAVIGHNISFDRQVLLSEFDHAGIEFTRDHFPSSICTMGLTRRRKLGLPNHQLATCYTHLLQRAPTTQLHTADGDARLCAEVYAALQGLSLTINETQLVELNEGDDEGDTHQQVNGNNLLSKRGCSDHGGGEAKRSSDHGDL